MINNRNIGKKLRELRMSRGWKQLDVAAKIGLSRPAISNIEAGKRSLTLSTLKRFCELYEIDISYFGIETENYNELNDLISRIDAIFNDNELDENKKDELYRTIMKIYLESK